MSDTFIDESLAKNSYRRDHAQRELDAAREELQALLVSGKANGWSVAEMARLAFISRDTAHRLLRDA